MTLIISGIDVPILTNSALTGRFGRRTFPARHGLTCIAGIPESPYTY